MLGISFWIFRLGMISLVTEPQRAEGVDFTKYKECSDKWDAQYPYLVEVRYTGRSDYNHQSYRYHMNRHGSLLTQKAVLTRAHDLEGFPMTSAGGDAPLHKDIKSCMNGGALRPCLYVNSRRPMNLDNPYQSDWCGFNSMVIKVYAHPKFGVTPLYEHDLRSVEYKKLAVQDQQQRRRDNLRTLWRTVQFPFAVLELQNAIITNKEQTIFPAMILPRTPLEMLYMLRRMQTRGRKSKLCEFPHYDRLSNQGYYGPYDQPDLIIATEYNCSIDGIDTAWPKAEAEIFSMYGSAGVMDYCLRDAMCPGKNINAYEEDTWSWEGAFKLDPSVLEIGAHSYQERVQFLKSCEDVYFGTNVFPLSHSIFLGERTDFFNDSRPLQVQLGLRFNDKLGSPVVCNGVTLALVSSWTERGRRRHNVYISTSLFRGWSWIIEMKSKMQVPHWHRASDDNALLDVPFRKRSYAERNYDKSVFELSLNEATDPKGRQFSHQNRNQLDLKITLFLLTSHVLKHCC